VALNQLNFRAASRQPTLPVALFLLAPRIFQIEGLFPWPLASQSPKVALPQGLFSPRRLERAQTLHQTSRLQDKPALGLICRLGF